MSPNMAMSWVTPRAKAQNSPQGERVGTRGSGWLQGLDEGRGRRGLRQRLRDDVSRLLQPPFPTSGAGPRKAGAASGTEDHIQARR